MDSDLTPDPVAAKAALRRRALDARATVPDRARAEALIQQAIADLVARDFAGRPVAAYLAMRGEVDPLPPLARHDGPVALPVVLRPATPLAFRRWQTGDPLEGGLYGTRHPLPDAEPVTPALVLMPLAGFDGQGNRLGYGGGFYDRTLDVLRAGGPVAAVGVAFSVQEVPLIPAEGTDEPLDAIITEDGIFRFTPG